MSASFDKTPLPNSLQDASPFRQFVTNSHGISLWQLREIIPATQHRVFDRIVDVFKIPPSGVGLVGLLETIWSDLLALQRAAGPVPTWAVHLTDLRSTLRVQAMIEPNGDAYTARSTRHPILRAMLQPPASSLSIDEKRGLLSIRAVLTLHHVSNGTRLSDSASQTLQSWMIGKQRFGFEAPADYLSIEKLNALRTTLDPTSDTARLLTFLANALRTRPRDPFFEQAIVVVTNTQRDENHDEPGDETTSAPDTNGSNEHDRDLLRRFAMEAINAGPRRSCGVTTNSSLHSRELELIVPRILAAWRQTSAESMLAALVTLFTRVRPIHFCEIPLQLGEGAGIWLDVDNGSVCWNLDEIITGHTTESIYIRSPWDRFVRIPLPQEIALALRVRAQAITPADNLGVLFQMPLDELDRNTKEELRGVALTSHRPTLGRLSNTWARYVLSICQDETYASAVGLDFTVGTTATFNYVMLRPARITQILTVAYAKIGMSGKLASNPPAHIGSKRLPPDKEVNSLLNYVLAAAIKAHRSLTKRHSYDVLLSAHNSIVQGAYALFLFVTGGRPVSESTITTASIDCSTGLTEIVDKRSSAYHVRRLVILVPTARAWVIFYLQWLTQLAYRLRNINASLAYKIFCITRADGRGAIAPLFFQLASTGILPAVSPLLQGTFDSHGMQSNAGRHWIDAVFRDAGLDSAAIQAWAGRALGGQELFGTRSTAIPLEVLNRCAAVIEARIARFSIPTPPAIQARKWFPAYREIPPYVPALLRNRPPEALKSQPYEECPFAEGTPMDYALYFRILSVWRTTRIHSGIGGVAMSLVLEDGVINRSELFLAVWELLSGTIFMEREEYFVDLRDQALGLRRVRVSAYTVRLADKVTTVPSKEKFGAIITEYIASYLKASEIFASKNPIDTFLRIARAFASVSVPADLFAWIDCRSFARTTRVETVARHLTGQREPLCAPPGARRRHVPRTVDSSVTEAIGRAESLVAGGTAHVTALSRLDQDLVEMQFDFEDRFADNLLIGYCRYLIGFLVNVNTLQRYITAIKPFILMLAPLIEEVGEDVILDWEKVVSKYATSRIQDGIGGSPDVAALNHFLQWQGIDLRTFVRIGAPPSSFVYAEMPSREEANHAIALLESQSSAIGDRFDRASIFLRLLCEHPHRRNALAHLRLRDLFLAHHPHISIVPEAGGALKTHNASRVLFLKDEVLIAKLAVLRRRRESRFPDDPLVYVFGDDANARTLSDIETIFQLVGIALESITGSSGIRSHDIRHMTITERRLQAIAPDRPSSSALIQRQVNWRTTVEAGHGDPKTTTTHYASEFDRARRHWYNHLNVAIPVKRTNTFLESITGITDATYRQRACRGTDIRRCDLYEGFDRTMSPSLSPRIVDLRELVVRGKISIDGITPAATLDLPARTAIFIGLRVLGDPDEIATLVAQLTKDERCHLLDGLSVLDSLRNAPIMCRSSVRRSGFLKSIMDTGLALSLFTASAPEPILSFFASAIRVAGAPFESPPVS